MKNTFTLNVKDLENKYRIVTNNIIDIVWVLDAATLKYEYITPSIASLSGYTAEELIGKSIKERLMPESLHRALRLFEEEKQNFEKGLQTIRSIELELVHKNGTTYWVEIRTRFLREQAGPLKVIGITRDITERKQAERQKEALIKQLGEALAEKERLLKEIKVLRGLLPICSGCKRIRDHQGRWWPLDAYVKENTEAELTHTICPDCREVFYPDIP